METNSQFVAFDAFIKARQEQINNKSNKQVYGKAAEYAGLLTICQFKLVVWWRVNKHGQPYTVSDMQSNRNRMYIPSLDTITLANGIYTDHKTAHSTLLNYCLQNVDRIANAMVIVNDRVNDEELTIFKLVPHNVIQSRYVQPEWKKMEDGSIIYNGLETPAIRTDKMRYTEY